MSVGPAARKILVAGPRWIMAAQATGPGAPSLQRRIHAPVPESVRRADADAPFHWNFPGAGTPRPSAPAWLGGAACAAIFQAWKEPRLDLGQIDAGFDR